ncbi:hypothetical protein GGI07_004259 [Coemansia sp. Benny D115]|nr:hypothetical protein GGI07_004259 [Coemansia sp. Benny D115]
MPDNASLLTSGAKIYAKKRKAKKEQVEEVSFDPKARRTFLTGFHKRKVERREKAIEQAKQKDREELLKIRKETREQQQQEIVDKLRQSRAEYGLDTSSDEEDTEGEEEEEEEETEVLEDENSVTTVKVLRDFDPRDLALEEGFLEKKYTPQELIQQLKKKVSRRARLAEQQEQEAEKEKEAQRKKKQAGKRNKKFRYETKAKRAVRGAKEKAGNAKQRMNRKDKK